MWALCVRDRDREGQRERGRELCFISTLLCFVQCMRHLWETASVTIPVQCILQAVFQTHNIKPTIMASMVLIPHKQSEYYNGYSFIYFFYFTLLTQ